MNNSTLSQGHGNAARRGANSLAIGLVLAAGLCAAPTIFAADWTMFRGSQALLGIAPGALPEKLDLLWSFKTQGPVKSSAAIVGGRVFIGSDDGHLYALDVATGKVVWSAKTDGGIESSPLVLDGRVFVGSSDSSLYAFEAATGKVVWKYATGDKILGAPNWVKSPHGDTNWVLVGSYDFKLYCLDAATGRSNWVYEANNYINGAPAVADGVTAFGGCDAILHVIALTNGTKVKEIEAGGYIAGSLAMKDHRAYFGHFENEFLCIDIARGARQWVYRDRNFPYFSSPAIAGERVIVGGRDKKLHCLDRETGKSLWTFPTQGKVDSSPVVCGDKVVVGSDDGRLYLVSLAAGKQLWSYEIGQPVSSSPAVADGRVVVGSEDGSVYCFGKK